MKRKTKERIKDVVLWLLAFGSAALYFSACSPCERLARRCPPVAYERDSIHVTDTLWFETLVIDTPMFVKLPPEYIYLVRPHNDTVKGETAFTRGMAWCDGESLNLELMNKDSAEVLVQRIKTLERRLLESYREKETGKVRTEYKTRGIVKVGAWIGLVAVVLTVLYLIFLVLKKI